MKKIINLLLGIIFIISLTACHNKADPKQNIEKLPICYIGTYSKTTAMGETIGGHLIMLNDDSDLAIYSGMFSGMGGVSVYPFFGTYKLNGNDLMMTYEPMLEKKEQISTNTIINNDSFRCLLQTEGGSPNDGLVEDVPGLNYYKTVSFCISDKVDTIYIASKLVDNRLSLGVLILNTDFTFNYLFKENDIEGSISGDYKIIINDLDEDNLLELNYKCDNTSEIKHNLLYDVASLTFDMPLGNNVVANNLKSIAVYTPLLR